MSLPQPMPAGLPAGPLSAPVDPSTAPNRTSPAPRGPMSTGRPSHSQRYPGRKKSSQLPKRPDGQKRPLSGRPSSRSKRPSPMPSRPPPASSRPPAARRRRPDSTFHPSSRRPPTQRPASSQRPRRRYRRPGSRYRNRFRFKDFKHPPMKTAQYLTDYLLDAKGRPAPREKANHSWDRPPAPNRPLDDDQPFSFSSVPNDQRHKLDNHQLVGGGTNGSRGSDWHDNLRPDYYFQPQSGYVDVTKRPRGRGTSTTLAAKKTSTSNNKTATKTVQPSSKPPSRPKAATRAPPASTGRPTFRSTKLPTAHSTTSRPTPKVGNLLKNHQTFYGQFIEHPLVPHDDHGATPVRIPSTGRPSSIGTSVPSSRPTSRPTSSWATSSRPASSNPTSSSRPTSSRPTQGPQGRQRVSSRRPVYRAKHTKRPAKRPLFVRRYKKAKPKRQKHEPAVGDSRDPAAGNKKVRCFTDDVSFIIYIRLLQCEFVTFNLTEASNF